MTTLCPAEGKDFKFSHLIGTGGIGSGLFFRLEGNHTLGRNESRLGDLSNFKDYCKLHIITHYISVLLSSAATYNSTSKISTLYNTKKFMVYPIGKVGSDETGKRLQCEIESAGMMTEHISIETDYSTLFSVCFQYPDHTGGNITTKRSASSKVSSEDIDLFFDWFQTFQTSQTPQTTQTSQTSQNEKENELILAVPEVPVETRIHLLLHGKKRRSFNIASVLVSEVELFETLNGFGLVDLLAVNIDEAAKIAQLTDEAVYSLSSGEIADKCIHYLISINPDISILITDGPYGSYAYKNGVTEFTHILEVPVTATAGAGDTFLAGTIVGLCCNLPFLKGYNDAYFAETPINSAVELGTILAALAVTSPHAIHYGINAKLLYEFSIQNSVSLSKPFQSLFTNCIAIE